MAAVFETDLFDVGLDAMAADLVSVSLHEATPVGGSNEVSGGTYTRQTPQWAPADTGVVGIDSSLVFDVPGGSTLTAVGLWADDGGPVWMGYIDLDDEESFGADGQFTVTALTITAANETP